MHGFSMKVKNYLSDKRSLQKLSSALGRKPKPLEEVLASALWNEHCSYASSRNWLKKFNFQTSKKLDSLGEQAGVVSLGQGEKVSFKMESHNHPSFIAPYHGAGTGVGGVLRDIFAMAARPIALANYLCFGEAKAEGNAARVEGVIRGIGDYGNCVGVPNITGRTEFSSVYNNNILVNAMALGYLGSHSPVMSAKALGVGNYVVYAGSSTGRDGILGADMASRALKEGGESDRPSIQVGDPFFGKQLMEACLLSMERGLITACQDMGAAGLTCSVFEMSAKGSLGMKLDLDKVPLREENLSPEEILLSESQERMLFICQPSKWKELEKLFVSYELEICRIGRLVETKEVELFWKGQSLLKTDPEFWTGKTPLEDRPYVMPSPAQRVLPDRIPAPQKQIKGMLLSALSSPMARSRQFIYRQYDQRVGGNTLRDASYPVGCLLLPESGRELGIALSCRPHLMALDVQQGAKDAIFYPALQLALRGFQPWAVSDCLNFGNPEKEKIMGEFVLSVESIAEACKALDCPVISGNVSFYNESEGKNISPSPAIAMIGLKEEPGGLPKQGFETAGEHLYLIYLHQFWFQGACSSLFSDLEKSKKAYGALQDPLSALFIRQILELSRERLFLSARLVGKFGLAYSLARMVLDGGGKGFSLKRSFPLPLFQERLYEVLVSIEPASTARFKKPLTVWV